jgi:hypothetical protein
MNEDKVEIWASLGITKNLGNYESLRLDAGAKIMTGSINNQSDWEKLWAELDSQIEAKLTEIGDAGR